MGFSAMSIILRALWVQLKGFMPRWEAFDVPQRGRLAAYVEEFEKGH